jgi:hypothetical protein
VLALLFAGCLLVASLAAPRAARADGDPASDVLASQPLFLPSDGGFSQSDEVQLSALLAAARRSGYPIRLALIATRADLGSVTALWSMPRSYAQFLGQELSLVYHGTLLVVMPDGFGVVRVGGPAGGGGTAAAAGNGAAPAGGGGAASLPRPAEGTPMVAAAISAVRDLAAAAGHRLPAPTATAHARPASGSALGSVDLGSWLALAAGVAMVALAWLASFRARPPGRLRAR